MELLAQCRGEWARVKTPCVYLLSRISEEIEGNKHRQGHFDTKSSLIASWTRLRVLDIRCRLESGAECAIELTNWLLHFSVHDAGMTMDSDHAQWNACTRESISRILCSMNEQGSTVSRYLTAFPSAMQEFDAVTMIIMTVELVIIETVHEELSYLRVIFCLLKVHLPSFNSVLYGNILYHGLMVLNLSTRLSIDRSSCSPHDDSFTQSQFMTILVTVANDSSLLSVVIANIHSALVVNERNSFGASAMSSFLGAYVLALVFIDQLEQGTNVLKSISMADPQFIATCFTKVIDLAVVLMQDDRIEVSLISRLPVNLRGLHEQVKGLSRGRQTDIAEWEAKLQAIEKACDLRDDKYTTRPAKLPRIENKSASVESFRYEDLELIYDPSQSEAYSVCDLIDGAVNKSSANLSSIAACHLISRLAWKGGQSGEPAAAYLASRWNINHAIIPINELLHCFVSDELSNRSESLRIHPKFVITFLDWISPESRAARAFPWTDINLMRLERTLHYSMLNENFILSTLFSINLASFWLRGCNAFNELPSDFDNFMKDLSPGISIPVVISYWNWLLKLLLSKSVAEAKILDFDVEHALNNMIACLYVALSQSPRSFIEFAREALIAEQLISLASFITDLSDCKVRVSTMLRLIHDAYALCYDSIEMFIPETRTLLLHEISTFKASIWILRHLELSLLQDLGNRLQLKNHSFSVTSPHLTTRKNIGSGVFLIEVNGNSIETVLHVSSQGVGSRCVQKGSNNKRYCVDHLRKYSSCGDYMDSNLICIPDISTLLAAAIKMKLIKESLEKYSDIVKIISQDVYLAIDESSNIEDALISELISFCEGYDWCVPPSACEILCIAFCVFYEAAYRPFQARREALFVLRIVECLLPALRDAFLVYNKPIFPDDNYLLFLFRTLDEWLACSNEGVGDHPLPAIFVDIAGTYPQKIDRFLAKNDVSSECRSLAYSMMNKDTRNDRSHTLSPLGSFMHVPLSSSNLTTPHAVCQQSDRGCLSPEPRSPQPFKAAGAANRAAESNQSLIVGPRELFSEQSMQVDGDSVPLVPSPIDHMQSAHTTTAIDVQKSLNSTPPSIKQGLSTKSVAPAEVLTDIDITALSKKFSVPFRNNR